MAIRPDAAGATVDVTAAKKMLARATVLTRVNCMLSSPLIDDVPLLR
jgi:hypothetical protein